MQLDDGKRMEMYEKAVNTTAPLKKLETLNQSLADIFRNPMDITTQDVAMFEESAERLKEFVNSACVRVCTQINELVSEVHDLIEKEN